MKNLIFTSASAEPRIEIRHQSGKLLIPQQQSTKEENLEDGRVQEWRWIAEDDGKYNWSISPSGPSEGPLVVLLLLKVNGE